MLDSKRLAVIAILGLWGCGPTIVLEEEDTDSDGEGMDGPNTTASTFPGTTTLPPSTTTPPPSTTTSPPPSDDDTLDDSVGFIPEPDDHSNVFECSIWEQDCPPAEKCMPWANDGGNSWNATRCSPIDEDPGAPGDPCTVEGSGVSGVDSCQLGAMCWNVDPETNEGNCVAFCVGDETNPYCEDPSSTCNITGDSVLALCLPNCDPILQDCPDAHACYPVNEQFMCVPDASGDMGAAGDPCEYINACDGGTFCANSELVPGCMGAAGCCTPFCELDDPMPPCLMGQVCSPYFEPGQAPPGHELLGACVLP